MKKNQQKRYQIELKKILETVVKEYKPEKVILFGSGAWGELVEGSDLDLFIIKKGVEKQRRSQRYQEVSSLIDHDIPIDFLVYTPYEVEKRLYLGDPFIKKIINRGKVIYGASSSSKRVAL